MSSSSKPLSPGSAPIPTTPTTTRKALVCRDLSEAVRGGTVEEVSLPGLKNAFGHLVSLEPKGSSETKHPTLPGEPTCPLVMPEQARLLWMRHGGRTVGVVVPTFQGGGEAQRDGIISQASAEPRRENWLVFFQRQT